jgi:hypothetical protein
MAREYGARIDARATIEFRGVDFGNKGPMKVVKTTRNNLVSPTAGEYLVVKHPGGSCWQGLGMPHAYIRAYFMVFCVKRGPDETGDGTIELEQIIEFDVSLKEAK